MLAARAAGRVRPVARPVRGPMAAGFLLGGIGHLYQSKTLIAAGIGLIFMATLGLPLGIYLSDR